jgi:hypothetical protein
MATVIHQGRVVAEFDEAGAAFVRTFIDIPPLLSETV